MGWSRLLLLGTGNLALEEIDQVLKNISMKTGNSRIRFKRREDLEKLGYIETDVPCEAM